MNFYSVYGLNIESEIAFPELPIQNPDACPGESRGIHSDRVVVRRDEAARRDGNGTFATETAGEVFVAHKGVGGFLMRDGREILFAPEAGVDEGAVRLFLLGTALAVLMHQRGLLVLHASAIAVDGGAVAFLGASGQGKSTTAAALHALGYDLVADDLVPVDLRVAMGGDETISGADACALPNVFPGFPQLKLWPEAAEALNACHLYELYPETRKRANRVTERFRDRPLPLRRIFVLDAATDEAASGEESQLNASAADDVLPHEYSCSAGKDENAPRVQLLAPRQACIELVSNSYCFPLIDDLRQENGASHLAQCADLARRVPVCRLRSRFAQKGLSALPDLAKLVLDDLANDTFFHPGENHANSRRAP